MNQSQTEQLLTQYRPLLLKVIRQSQIHYANNNYDDYYQELAIKLIELADKFKGDPFDQEKYQFIAYAQKGLKWHLLDLLRATPNQEQPIDLSEITFVADPDPLVSDTLSAFYSEVKKKLTDEEYQLFNGLSQSYTLNELANLFAVSKKTISKRKKKLLKKISGLKEILLN